MRVQHEKAPHVAGRGVMLVVQLADRDRHAAPGRIGEAGAVDDLARGGIIPGGVAQQVGQFARDGVGGVGLRHVDRGEFDLDRARVVVVYVDFIGGFAGGVEQVEHREGALEIGDLRRHARYVRLVDAVRRVRLLAGNAGRVGGVVARGPVAPVDQRVQMCAGGRRWARVAGLALAAGPRDRHAAVGCETHVGVVTQAGGGERVGRVVKGCAWPRNTAIFQRAAGPNLPRSSAC